MSPEEIEERLNKLREKYQFVKETWARAGNRQMLNFIVEIGPRLFQCERVSIFIHDPAANNAWLLCGTDLRERQIIVSKSNSFVGQVIHNRRLMSKFNMIHQKGAHQDIDLETGFMTRNAMCAPMMDSTGDRVIGAIELLNKREAQAFNDEDQRYLEKVIGHIDNQVEIIYQRQELVKIAQEIQIKINKLKLKLTPREGEH
ncbi:GAF domain-containing protein [Ectothiorhodospiraceae bacterium BW-2]|nr:GAF domain-containing protein [Ectothiorhodospiraceae bacterium BW-2]